MKRAHPTQSIYLEPYILYDPAYRRYGGKNMESLRLAGGLACNGIRLRSNQTSPFFLSRVTR